MPDFPKTLQAVSIKEARKISLYKIRETIGKINTAIVSTAVNSNDNFELAIPLGRDALRLKKALAEFYADEGWYTAIRRRQVSPEPNRRYRLCIVISTKPVKVSSRKKDKPNDHLQPSTHSR